VTCIREDVQSVISFLMPAVSGLNSDVTAPGVKVKGGLLSAKIVKNATLKVYKGAPHGMPSTHKDEVNADLLAFCREGKLAAA
jgi:hypothetical protein